MTEDDRKWAIVLFMIPILIIAVAFGITDGAPMFSNREQINTVIHIWQKGESWR